MVFLVKIIPLLIVVILKQQWFSYTFLERSLSKYKLETRNSGSQKTLSAWLHFAMWLNVLSLFLTYQATPPSAYFTATVLKHGLQIQGDSYHPTHHRPLFSPFQETPYSTITVGVNCAPVIYGLPALHGYATVHVFRCIIWVSWDLIKITASKIPFKWNCS